MTTHEEFQRRIQELEEDIQIREQKERRRREREDDELRTRQRKRRLEEEDNNTAQDAANQNAVMTACIAAII